MNEGTGKPGKELMAGNWCMVDLSDAVAEEATKLAHALGIDLHAFMCLAVEEKLARLRGNA